jgi:hypothetical protein
MFEASDARTVLMFPDNRRIDHLNGGVIGASYNPTPTPARRQRWRLESCSRGKARGGL